MDEDQVVGRDSAGNGNILGGLKMNLTFALFLIGLISQNQYCYLQQGCFRYNCADFTHDAIFMLRFDGFTAYPMCGWMDHKYHAWIGLELDGNFYNIEPQIAEIIYPNGDNYKFGRRCVVRGLV